MVNRTHLEETIRRTLLVESRIKDVKKKFPELHEGGWIDVLSAADPSGNNKYLMWMAREMWKVNLDEPNTSGAGWILRTPEPFEWPEDNGFDAFNDDYPLNADAKWKGRFERIRDAVKLFDKNKQRMKIKDLQQYKELEDLEGTIQSLGLTSKEKKKKKKETAMEGSSIVYESDNFFVVRPETHAASCYYGQNTEWCISSRDTSRHFEDYTREGLAFYMIRIEDIPDDRDKNKRLAMVYTHDAELPEEVYDATDDQIGFDRAARILGRYGADGEPSKIFDAISSHLHANPPSLNWDKELQEIQEVFQEQANFIDLNYDMDESLWVYGSMYIDLDKLHNTKYNFPAFSEKTLDAIEEDEGMLRDAVDQALGSVAVYYENFEKVDPHVFRIGFRSEHEETPEGFGEFAEELLQYDERIPQFIQNFYLELGRYSVGPGSKYLDFQEHLENTLQNLDVDYDDEEGSLDIEGKVSVKFDVIRHLIKTLFKPEETEEAARKAYEVLKDEGSIIMAGQASWEKLYHAFHHASGQPNPFQGTLPGIPKPEAKFAQGVVRLMSNSLRTSSSYQSDHNVKVYRIQFYIPIVQIMNNSYQITTEEKWYNSIRDILEFLDENQQVFRDIFAKQMYILVLRKLRPDWDRRAASQAFNESKKRLMVEKLARTHVKKYLKKS